MHVYSKKNIQPISILQSFNALHVQLNMAAWTACVLRRYTRTIMIITTNYYGWNN